MPKTEYVSPEALRSFLRSLQQNPYQWPNRYFAWRKPDQTLLIVGVASTQMYQLLKYEFYQSEGQARYGIPGDYAPRFYDINPRVSHMLSGNVMYDPVERLVSEVRNYTYLGSWDDPDIFMETPHSFSRQRACGRWDLAKEHILGSREEENPPLTHRISDASERSANQPYFLTPNSSKER